MYQQCLFISRAAVSTSPNRRPPPPTKAGDPASFAVSSAMISKALLLFMLIFAIFAVAYADQGLAACDDEIKDGSCNVVKSFCGQEKYLKESSMCKRTCGMCGPSVLEPVVIN